MKTKREANMKHLSKDMGAAVAGCLLLANLFIEAQITSPLKKVLGAAQQVASTEIATANNDLSSRTEQTAAAMEQQTATVRQNYDTAQQASQLANAPKQATTQGGEAVGNAVSPMAPIAEITSASKEQAIGISQLLQDYQS
jgi:methyl-accepting chemotaxis protein